MAYWYKKKKSSYSRSYYYKEPSYEGTDREAWDKAGEDAYDEGLDSYETSERYYEYKNGTRKCADCGCDISDRPDDHYLCYECWKEKNNRW